MPYSARGGRQVINRQCKQASTALLAEPRGSPTSYSPTPYSFHVELHGRDAFVGRIAAAAADAFPTDEDQVCDERPKSALRDESQDDDCAGASGCQDQDLGLAASAADHDDV